MWTPHAHWPLSASSCHSHSSPDSFSSETSSWPPAPVAPLPPRTSRNSGRNPYRWTGSWTLGLDPPPPPPLSLSLSLSLSRSLVSPSVLPAPLSSPSLSSKQAPARAPGQLFLSAGEEESEALPLFLALVQPRYGDRGKDTLCALSPPSPFFLYKLWKHLSLRRTRSHMWPPQIFGLHPLPPQPLLFVSHTQTLVPYVVFLGVSRSHSLHPPGLTHDPWFNARQGFTLFISFSPSPFIFLFFPIPPPQKKLKTSLPSFSLRALLLLPLYSGCLTLTYTITSLFSPPHPSLLLSSFLLPDTGTLSSARAAHGWHCQENSQEKPNSDGSC